jgi:predicted amidohydrolase
MKVILVQAPLIWENPAANRAYFSKVIESSNKADLFVLPEMFTSGFTMNAPLVAEAMDGATVSWMLQTASSCGAAIAGSIVVKDSNSFYNRFLFATPDGEISYYDKRHLFTLAGEDRVYKRGENKKVITFNNWKICLQICYDLRFPAFSRNVESYDLLIYVANWPQTRIYAWDQLLKARAIENMCYVVGVNRIGIDEMVQNYPGHSQVIDFLGHELIGPNKIEGLFEAFLDYHSMHEIRKKLGFLNDRDEVTVN